MNLREALETASWGRVKVTELIAENWLLLEPSAGKVSLLNWWL